MRNAFAESLTKLAASNKKIVLLSGDIGNRLFDKFKKKFPKRFYNCGVAEANMTGVASGLASMGFVPITYTITPFNTARCFENIKLDICYPKLPVIIVGTGSGLSYSTLGSSHHSMEDIAILRTLPNINVICPGDPIEVKLALIEAIKSKKPTYLRIGKKGEPIVHKRKPLLKIGRVNKIFSGKNIVIIGVGNVLQLAVDCRNILKKYSIDAEVASFHSIKPLDKYYLNKKINEKKLIVIIEEHGFTGGAASAVLEFANNKKKNVNILSISGPDRFLTAYGNQKNSRKRIGLDPNKIVKKILNSY